MGLREKTTKTGGHKNDPIGGKREEDKAKRQGLREGELNEKGRD